MDKEKKNVANSECANSTQTVSLVAFNNEVNAKNKAYHFIAEKNLLEEFHRFSIMPTIQNNVGPNIEEIKNFLLINQLQPKNIEAFKEVVREINDIQSYCTTSIKDNLKDCFFYSLTTEQMNDEKIRWEIAYTFRTLETLLEKIELLES